MTFKKNNKSAQQVRKLFSKRGQALLEYFILTTVVVTVVLFFASSKFFTNSDRGNKGIKEICEDAFDKAIGEILE